MIVRSVCVLNRWGGLGDVLMALCAAKAVKIQHQALVILATQPGYSELVSACPYVDGVISNSEDFNQMMQDPRIGKGAHPEAWESVRHFDLNPISFGVCGIHQVDAYLTHMGFQAPAALKSLRLELSPTTVATCSQKLGPDSDAENSRRVLLHPAVGDPNRTWPKEAWAQLAMRLLAEGYRVAFIGEDRADPHRGVHRIELPGALDLVNQFTPLELVALMQRSALLVSTDSGPVQLAGATEIPILGIYSVVKGSNRLPFRNGLPGWRSTAMDSHCLLSPCYAKVLDEQTWKAQAKKAGVQEQDAPVLLPQWCLAERPFECMSGLTNYVDQVVAEAQTLLKQNSR